MASSSSPGIGVGDRVERRTANRDLLAAASALCSVSVCYWSLASAYGLYASISWLVQWLEAREGGFISAANLGWITGWLMVLPNAVLALYWGWKRRADIVYSPQVGDGHICIPLCLGLFALFRSLPLGTLFEPGMLMLLGATVLNGLSALLLGGLPRWAGALLAAGYGWFSGRAC